MSARRVVAPRKPVTLFLDGEKIVAEQGEPIAQALIAADRVALARSPKLHRPRGPACFRGGCDGCLVRMDGVPNIMSCLRPATEGVRVETQNVLGTRRIDLLQVTDWFFPNGIDHHHLLAGVPGLAPIMQSMARRIAGLGTLPDASRPITPGRRRSHEMADGADVVIVGAGPSGIAAASRLSALGKRVVLIDDALEVGGAARALGRDALSSLLAKYPLDRVEVLSRTVAAGVHEGDVLAVGPGEAQRIRPKALVLATGSHDSTPLIEGNDLPGVYSARAAALLAASGVLVGQRLCVIGEGPLSTSFIALIDQLRVSASIDVSVVRIALDTLVKLDGVSRVGAVIARDASGKERRIRVDAVAIDTPGAPCFELCEQAGAVVHYANGKGFVPVASEGGREHSGGLGVGAYAVAPGVWALGELTGVAFDLATLTSAGERVATDVAAFVGS